MIIRNHKTRQPRKGMALLVVLFIVMAIAIISSGFIARSDASLQSGRNYCVRNEIDYLAWGGLEHAWALVQDPNGIPFEQIDLYLDATSDLYYDLTVDMLPADPNTYSVECTARKSDSDAKSTLYGILFHDSDGSTYYTSISR